MSIRILAVLAVLPALGCLTVASPPAGGGATIIVSRSSLGAVAAPADSVHLVMARLDGAVVAEAGAPFAADSVTITIPVVLLDEREQFRLTFTLFSLGQNILTESIVVTAHRGASTGPIRVKPREWSLGAGLAPSPRDGAALAFVPGLGGALLAGGVDAMGDSLNDAWVFDGTSWRQAPPMPDFRRNHVIVPIGGDSAVVFGGLPAQPAAFLTRVLVFDGTRWSQGQGPVSRDRSAGVFDPEHHQVVLFGGASPDPAHRGATTILFDRYWRELDVPGPSARVGHAMVYDPDRRAVILLGGTSLAGVDLSDVWLWKDEQSGWSPVVTYGAWPARSGHAAFYDPARGAVVVVGGQHDGTVLDDIWELRGDTWTELAPQQRPSARAGPGGFSTSRDVGLLVSGRGPAGLVSDWWIYR